MSNSKKIPKVPNLRFPEFEAEWENIILTELGNFIGGGTPSSTNLSYWKGSIPWISSSDLDESNINAVRARRFITQEAIDNSATKLCDAPVILIVSRVGVGKIAYSTNSLCTSQDFLNITNIKCNGLFLAYLLSIIMRKEASNVQGTSIKGISSNDIKSKKIFIPNAKEQKKIASLLLLIDARIQTQSKIIQRLETLMQNLREKIFKQKLRFKDNIGNDFPGWEIKNLGEIGKTYNGLIGKTKENFGVGKKYIQYKQIFDSSKIQIDRCELVNIFQNENQNEVQYGDIFFTISSEVPDEIGMSSILLDEVREMYLNSFCFGYRPDSLEILNPIFARYLFRSKVFRGSITKLAQGSTRYNMSKIELMKLEISLPTNQEQKCISNFLSYIDGKIEAEKNILEKYETHKKYLLQNMFI